MSAHSDVTRVGIAYQEEHHCKRTYAKEYELSVKWVVWNRALKKPLKWLLVPKTPMIPNLKVGENETLSFWKVRH